MRVKPRENQIGVNSGENTINKKKSYKCRLTGWLCGVLIFEDFLLQCLIHNDMLILQKLNGQKVVFNTKLC